MAVSSQVVVIDAARKYWQLRNAGNIADERGQAHNVLLDALEAAGIPFEDREHAAQIGLTLMNTPINPTESMTTLMVNCQASLKADFKRFAKRYGGMTAVVLRLMNEFVEKEKQACRS